MEAAVVQVRRLACTAGAVRIGGDSVVSMGGRGVDGRDVKHALEHAHAAEIRGPDLICTGPTVDGEPLTIILRILDDTLHVSNVIL